MTTDLGVTGQAIWDAYEGSKLDAGSAALVRELARCADTLDRLDGLVIGKREVWVTLVFDDMGEVHLSVDKLLDQRRNHQLALKQLTAEVRSAGLRPKDSKTTKAADEEPEDMLGKRRKEREQRERQHG